MDWLTQPAPLFFIIVAIFFAAWLTWRSVDRLADEVRRLKNVVRGLPEDDQAP